MTFASDGDGLCRGENRVFPVLPGERIRLDALDHSAIPDLHEYSCDPSFYAHLEFPPFRTLAETEGYFEKLKTRSSGGKGHYWLIRLNEDGKAIGTFGVLDIDWRKGSGEIGYGLSPVFWGKGLFREALALVLNHLFGSLGFHRVWVKTQETNTPSLRTLERIGFVHEGMLRDFYLSQQDGQYHNAVVLAMLESEWRTLSLSR